MLVDSWTKCYPKAEDIMIFPTSDLDLHYSFRQKADYNVQCLLTVRC